MVLPIAKLQTTKQSDALFRTDSPRKATVHKFQRSDTEARFAYSPTAKGFAASMGVGRSILVTISKNSMLAALQKPGTNLATMRKKVGKIIDYGSKIDHAALSAILTSHRNDNKLASVIIGVIKSRLPYLKMAFVPGLISAAQSNKHDAVRAGAVAILTNRVSVAFPFGKSTGYKSAYAFLKNALSSAKDHKLCRLIVKELGPFIVKTTHEYRILLNVAANNTSLPKDIRKTAASKLKPKPKP